jgi:hypothetical protein
MTFDQVYDVLTRTADHISPGICVSNGRVNLSGAMYAVIPSRGYISFDSDYYASPSVARMLLADWDLKGVGTQQATIMTSGGDLEKVVLTENYSVPGIFTGSISTGTGESDIGDGTVQVISNDVITAIYFDSNDGAGNPAATMDSAVIDAEAPVLLNIQVDTQGHAANITFSTDEPAETVVRCGLAPGGPYIFTQQDIILSNNHTVKLQPLSLNTDYYFVIDLIDKVGNKVTADNNGLYYSFTTSVEFAGYRVPGVYPTIQAAIDDASDGDTIWMGNFREKGISISTSKVRL